MPTRLSDISLHRRAFSAKPQAQRETTSSPPDLPLGTCGTCEHVNFAMFEGAAMGDEEVYMSPDRRRLEKEGEERPLRFKCRYCGRVVNREDSKDLGRIRRTT